VLVMSDPSVSFTPSDQTHPPRSYLGAGLVATVLCFLPLGLVTLYFGLRVRQAVADGDTERAMHDSHVARGWLAATIVIGVLLYVFIAGAFALLGAFSN
jgi:hypothetical protein